MKVSKRAYKALERTIRYWEKQHEKYAAKKVPVHGKLYSALCNLYNSGDDGCGVCPIKKKTGKNFCYGSPYYVWLINMDATSHKAMINWMKKLLKECEV